MGRKGVTNKLLRLRKKKNRAGYTATEVARGWAGAIFEVTRAFGQEQWGKKIEIMKRVKRDRPTDPQTKWVIESRACD